MFVSCDDWFLSWNMFEPKSNYKWKHFFLEIFQVQKLLFSEMRCTGGPHINISQAHWYVQLAKYRSDTPMPPNTQCDSGLPTICGPIE